MKLALIGALIFFIEIFILYYTSMYILLINHYLELLVLFINKNNKQFSKV